MGDADHPDTALPLISASRPHVLFLDLQMAGADAFDLLARLEEHPRIVFTTAHAEYAVRSFEFDTVDYLLKPISDERLAQAIRKLEARDSVAAPDAPRAPLDERSRIFIKDGERCHMVPLSAIRCFKGCKNHVQVYFDQQRSYIKKSLNSVEERLPRSMFFRVSRQHIVNLGAIASIEEGLLPRQRRAPALCTGARRSSTCARRVPCVLHKSGKSPKVLRIAQLTLVLTEIFVENQEAAVIGDLVFEMA